MNMNAFMRKTAEQPEFSQPHPVVADDALPDVGTAAVSTVLSLCENLSHTQAFPVSRNFVTNRRVFVLLCMSLSGYTLLNALLTAANDFDAK
jgi:hypothetical protein